MSLGIRPKRHFSMSSFNALIGLRRYLARHTGLPVGEAIEALKSIDGDMASTDFASAVELHGIVVSELTFEDVPRDMRTALENLVHAHQPWWRALFPLGRNHVEKALTDDERQVFVSAKLLDADATAEIMLWWYRIAAQARAESDLARAMQGGEAELLTLEYERQRLASLGIGREPEWVAIDTNSAGYDVRSYDVGAFEPVARLIEVKSSTVKPPRIILPRTEWDKAVGFGNAYYIYVWALPEKAVTILKAAEIMKHIPVDQGAGKWREAEIRIEQ